MTDYSYIGKGRFAIRKRGEAGPFRFIGNCPVLSFTVTEDEKSLVDSQKPGGGKIESVRRTTAVPLNVELTNFNYKNIALVTGGDGSEIVSGTVTDESITGYHDGLIPLAHIGASSMVLTSDPAGTTYDLGTDYELESAGLAIPAAPTFADGAALLASYAYGGYNVVEAFTNAADEYEGIFTGLNEARSGLPGVGYLHRIVFGRAGMQLISDDFTPIPLAGELLADSTRPAGESPFFRWAAAEVAA